MNNKKRNYYVIINSKNEFMDNTLFRNFTSEISGARFYKTINGAHRGLKKEIDYNENKNKINHDGRYYKTDSAQWEIVEIRFNIVHIQG